MTAIDHEAEYNNRIRIAEFPAIIARWHAASAAYRPGARAELDQPYGPGERQRYDLFPSGQPGAPLIVYLHGGYWFLGGREDTAFVARGFTDAGLDIAIPSYSLCPAVSIAAIIEDVRSCLAALWARTGKRPLLAGHSAGGHLAAAMLATDWSRRAGVPPDLVRAAFAISGVFELAPLIPTTMNAALRLDPASAAEASPILWPPPPPGRALVAAVGADETAEFHRQSRSLVERWGSAGVATEYLAIAGANHFTVVDELTRPSVLFDRMALLARA